MKKLVKITYFFICLKVSKIANLNSTSIMYILFCLITINIRFKQLKCILSCFTTLINFKNVSILETNRNAYIITFALIFGDIVLWFTERTY